MVASGLAALFAADSRFKRANDDTKSQKQPTAADTPVEARRADKRKHQHPEQPLTSLTPAKKRKPSPETQPEASAAPARARLSRKQRKAVKDAQADSDDGGAPEPVAPRPSKEQEAEKLARTVFVGNLPADVRKKHVARLFAPCGTVAAVRLRSLPLPLDGKMRRANSVKAGVVDAARGSAHAYVVFQHADAVDKALKLNMSVHNGLHLRVDRAAPRSSRLEAATNRFDKRTASTDTGGLPAAYDPTRSVFVGNLHFETQDEELITLFNDAADMGDMRGHVEAVRCVRDGATNVGKGIAFVLFTDKAAARTALGLSGSKVHGRAIRVQRCKSMAPSVNASAAKARVQRKSGAGVKRTVPLVEQSTRPAMAGNKGSPKDAATTPRRVARVGAGAFVPVTKAPWQGTRTSAGGKGGRGAVKLRGATPAAQRAAVATARQQVGQRTKAKRPAVLARKQKQRAARGK